MAAVEFDFEALERPPATLAPEEAADEVMATLAQARADADSLREAARDEGYAAGRAEALEALEPALAALGEAIAAVHAEQAEAGAIVISRGSGGEDALV